MTKRWQPCCVILGVLLALGASCGARADGETAPGLFGGGDMPISPRVGPTYDIFGDGKARLMVKPYFLYGTIGGGDLDNGAGGGLSVQCWPSILDGLNRRLPWGFTYTYVSGEFMGWGDANTYTAAGGLGWDIPLTSIPKWGGLNLFGTLELGGSYTYVPGWEYRMWNSGCCHLPGYWDTGKTDGEGLFGLDGNVGLTVAPGNGKFTIDISVKRRQLFEELGDDSNGMTMMRVGGRVKCN